MNTTLWIVQGVLGVAFLYSGICKSLKPEPWLITHGQTGVVGLPGIVIKLIGISEILGVAGLILPVWLNISPVLTSVSAVCFCILMLFAMRIHYKLNEPKNVMVNITLFLLGALVVYGRSGF